MRYWQPIFGLTLCVGLTLAGCASHEATVIPTTAGELAELEAQMRADDAALNAAMEEGFHTETGN